MKAVNPATEEIVGEYPDHDDESVHRAMERAEEAFAAWREAGFEFRGQLMLRVASVLRRRVGELAELMTREMGKPIASAEAEIEKCAITCEYFAEFASRLLDIEQAATDATRSYVRFDPLGPVLAIMPWNFPFWQAFRFAAPGLMAGNVGVLKHAWNVPGCGLAIESAFREAGFETGVFTNLLLDNQRAEALIAHPGIRAVTLTGSERAGRAVAAAAGRVLKKSVLELGGSDAFIVLEDADIAATAEAAAGARCINSGQSCIAAKRFLVAESLASRFEEAFTARMSALRVGDPMDRRNDLGPLARADLREALHEQVRRSVDAGARLLCGGQPLPGRGYYYPPTVLADVRPGMPAFDEETFGPVAAVTRYRTLDEAVELANRSRFGLGASLWTHDAALAEAAAARIEAGSVFINGAVRSDARLPFGGVKNSGYGRELAEIGIREFMNIKTIWVREQERTGRVHRSE